MNQRQPGEAARGKGRLVGPTLDAGSSSWMAGGSEVVEQDRSPGRDRKVEELLGSLEASCLHVLWAHGPGDVSTVREAVNAQQSSTLAYTTVMTVLARLHEKGFLTRQRRGRGYTYTPAYTEAQLIALLGRRDVDRLVERYGDVALAHFAETLRRTDPELLRRVERLAQDDTDE